jgi:hypothetical protein
MQTGTILLEGIRQDVQLASPLELNTLWCQKWNPQVEEDFSWHQESIRSKAIVIPSGVPQYFCSKSTGMAYFTAQYQMLDCSQTTAMSIYGEIGNKASKMTLHPFKHGDKSSR